MQPRNKCLLMKIDQHLEYLNTRTVLKFFLSLYLQSFEYLSSSISGGKFVVMQISVVILLFSDQISGRGKSFQGKSFRVPFE